LNTSTLKNRIALYQLRHRARGASANFQIPISNLQFSMEQADQDLIDLFQLPPEKAIEYFKGKSYAFSWDWREVWQEAQARAFTVAKAMRLDILQTIRDELRIVLDEGMMLRDFQKDLKPKLQALGWWGNHEIVDADGVVSSVQLGSPWRLRTIYETNIRTIYEAGSYREMMESMDDAPYGQFISVLDQNTRPAHRALNGLVFRLDDPFWDTHWPPLDWGCRCSVRQLSDRDVAKLRLTISEGAGHLTDQEIIVNGEPATVTVYSSGNIHVATGPGWNYNPGKVDWQPNVGKYDGDIAKLW